MSQKYENHRNVHEIRKMSPEEYRRYSKIKAEKVGRELQKIMRQIEKKVNDVEELLEDNVLEDKQCSVNENESADVEVEISAQSAGTAEDFSGKFARYEKILEESSKKSEKLGKGNNKKAKKKILKKLKKIRLLNKKCQKNMKNIRHIMK